jgi:restriction system protein
MAIPDFQTIMLPLMQLAKDGELHQFHDAVINLALYFNLTDAEKSNLLPSGQQPIFDNRVGWAKLHLKKAGLLDDPTRGFFKITNRGKEILQNSPTRIDMRFLQQFPEYKAFREKTPSEEIGNDKNVDLNKLTPDEVLELSYQRIRNELAEKLSDYTFKSTSGFFERLVVELLVNMGYGGSRQDAAKAVGQRGDEGIDGIIDEDRLGLDNIYIQAKKWEKSTNIGRPEIQKFVGALSGKKARKGIYITTADFTKEARDYAQSLEIKVILINGKKLADLMIDYDIGVTTRSIYELKILDSDYFGEIPI